MDSNRLDSSLLTLLQGDALENLKGIPSGSVDLIFTSPPYAEQRKKHYNGQAASKYIAWFVPIAIELKRILKPSGSFLLNIQANCEKGERLLYPLKLVLALSEIVGFRYIDEYCWYKSAAPGVCGPRLRPSWEPIYHFAIDVPFMNADKIQVYSRATFVNQKAWASKSITGNFGGYHHIADQAPGLTTSDNLLYFPTSLMVKDAAYAHPAKFPWQLALFLIKAFCPEKGTVCDPFVGSGSTALAALIYNCRCFAIDLEAKYCEMTKNRIADYSRAEEITIHRREMRELE